MPKTVPNARLVFALLFITCAALLGYGYYLQYAQGLEPCPLCIVQRLCFMGVAAASLLAAIHHPTARGIIAYGALTSVPILGGIATAGRQVWLQHLPPDKVPECGPGLEFWLQTLPITETVQKIFRGTGECAEVDWTFLSLSIAEWSLACFAVMLVAVVAVIVAAAGQRARDMKFL